MPPDEDEEDLWETILASCGALEERLDQVEMEMGLPASVGDNATLTSTPVWGGWRSPVDESGLRSDSWIY